MRGYTDSSSNQLSSSPPPPPSSSHLATPWLIGPLRTDPFTPLLYTGFLCTFMAGPAPPHPLHRATRRRVILYILYTTRWGDSERSCLWGVQVRVGQETIARVAVVCGWVLLPVMAVVAGLAVALLFLWAYSSRFVFV